MLVNAQARGRANGPTVSLAFSHFGSNVGDNAITASTIAWLQSSVWGSTIRSYHLSRGSWSEWGQEQVSDWVGKTVESTELGSLKERVARELERDPHLEKPERLLEACSDIDGFDEMRSTDLLVVPGGENLFCDGSRQQHIDLCVRLLPAICSWVDKTPCIWLPSTFGPFSGFASQRVTRFLRSNVMVSGARDLESVFQFAYQGEDSSVLPLRPDMAYLLPDFPGSRPAGAQTVLLAPRLDRYGLKSGRSASKQQIGLARKTRFLSSETVKLFLQLAQEFISRGWIVEIVAHAQADRDLAEYIATTVPASSVRLVDSLRLADIRDAYLRSDTVVTARFHGAVFGHLSQSRIVIVEFDNMSQKMKSVGAPFGGCSPRISAKSPGIVRDRILFQDSGQHVLETRINRQQAALRSELAAMLRKAEERIT